MALGDGWSWRTVAVVAVAIAIVPRPAMGDYLQQGADALKGDTLLTDGQREKVRTLVDAWFAKESGGKTLP
ncbi:MAG: hypothetical protein HY556_05255 [Euryarchaeota archaeon]|nr:hypothetical protein [Euryarchaeota archaeon]